MDYKRSARREATRFVESRISYREDNLSYGPPWAHYLGGYHD
jgi:hypothetical protein